MATLSFISTTKLNELLRIADPKGDMHVCIRSATELAIGIDPLNPTNVIDFAIEKSKSLVGAGRENSSNSGDLGNFTPKSIRFSRKRGQHWFEFDGKRTSVNSLKHLLSESLIAMETAKPGTLEQLCQMKGRSKRIVARERNQLFASQHLVEDFSEMLINGWYFGTNNSAAETKAWLGRAAGCVGGRLGGTFRTSLD